MNSLDIIDTLNPQYGSCEFCTLLYEGKCRYNLQKPLLNKCDECFLFYSKIASRYQKILKRYNNKEIKKNEIKNVCD